MDHSKNLRAELAANLTRVSCEDKIQYMNLKAEWQLVSKHFMLRQDTIHEFKGRIAANLKRISCHKCFLMLFTKKTLGHQVGPPPSRQYVAT